MTYQLFSHLIELDIFVLLNFQPYTVTQLLSDSVYDQYFDCIAFPFKMYVIDWNAN